MSLLTKCSSHGGMLIPVLLIQPKTHVIKHLFLPRITAKSKINYTLTRGENVSNQHANGNIDNR